MWLSNWWQRVRLSRSSPCATSSVLLSAFSLCPLSFSIVLYSSATSLCMPPYLPFACLHICAPAWRSLVVRPLAPPLPVLCLVHRALACASALFLWPSLCLALQVSPTLLHSRSSSFTASSTRFLFFLHSPSSLFLTLHAVTCAITCAVTYRAVICAVTAPSSASSPTILTRALPLHALTCALPLYAPIHIPLYALTHVPLHTLTPPRTCPPICALPPHALTHVPLYALALPLHALTHTPPCTFTRTRTRAL